MIVVAAGVAGMDTQTAMAVQSLLESQTTAEPATQGRLCVLIHSQPGNDYTAHD